jgi:hypothetical protein
LSRLKDLVVAEGFDFFYTWNGPRKTHANSNDTLGIVIAIQRNWKKTQQKIKPMQTVDRLKRQN